MQTIQINSLVTLHYSISIIDNENVIELANTFNEGTPATLTIGRGVLPPTIENHLLDKVENQSIDVDIENAFGMYNPELQQLISQELIKLHSNETEFEAGDVVSFNTPKGQVAGVFMQSEPNGSAWFDFNHPLCGRSIRFIAKIIGIINE